MPSRPLPNDPSLEHLRKEAKRLRQAVSSGDAGRGAVREFHPHAEGPHPLLARRCPARHRALVRIRELDEA